MAIVNKAEYDGILESIGNTTNASSELLGLFDKPMSGVTEKVSREWEGKYNSMVSEQDEARRAYRDRFLGK